MCTSKAPCSMPCVHAFCGVWCAVLPGPRWLSRHCGMTTVSGWLFVTVRAESMGVARRWYVLEADGHCVWEMTLLTFQCLVC